MANPNQAQNIYIVLDKLLSKLEESGLWSTVGGGGSTVTWNQMLEKIGTPADYVIESDSNANGWTWLKFNSGKCIAWYYASYTCTFSATSVTGIYSAPNWEAAVPSGLFSSTPVVTSNAKSSGIILTDTSDASTKDKIYVHMNKLISGGTIDVMMQLQCTGVWK